MNIKQLPVTAEHTSITSEVETQAGQWIVLKPWWKATLATLPVFLLTRFMFLILTYLGVILFTLPNYSYKALSLHDVIYGWYRWDATRFAAVAANGYQSLVNTAFFPLYPLFEHITGSLLHKDVFLAGMLISNLAFLGTLIVLYRFVETEFDRETAKRTTLYLAIFPTALFFFAAYNESLFLFFTLLSFYSMRRRSWWLAGLFGGLATLTRSIGMALLLIFLYEFVRQVFPQVREAWQNKIWRRLLALLSGLLAALLIPLGLGIYAYYLELKMHDPLAFSHAQVYWRHGLAAPWYSPFIAIRDMLTLSPFTFSTAHNLIDTTALFLFLALLVLCFVGPERFHIHQWSMLFFGLMVLALAVLFPGADINPLPSMERFVLEIFPAFILLARLGRRPWFHQAYLILALPLLAFFTLQFLTGHWTI